MPENSQLSHFPYVVYLMMIEWEFHLPTLVSYRRSSSLPRLSIKYNYFFLFVFFIISLLSHRIVEKEQRRQARHRASYTNNQPALMFHSYFWSSIQRYCLFLYICSMSLATSYNILVYFTNYGWKGKQVCSINLFGVMFSSRLR